MIICMKPYFGADAGIKKMATVHFTTTPCELNTTNRHEEGQKSLENSSLY